MSTRFAASLKIALAGAALCASHTGAMAAPLATVTLSASGPFNGALSNLIDGVTPPDYTLWNDTSTVSWGGTGTAFVFDLGQAYLLQDVTLNVDNNDYYFLQVSTDGTQWSALTTVLAFDGPVNSGMDTFSSQTGSPDYSPLIDFQPQLARYVRLSAVGGDNSYAVGEVSFNGVPAVPEPATVALTLAGAGVAAAAARRRKA